MVKHRSIVGFILLSIITFGIYPLVSMSIMTGEINSVCEGDGKEQMPYILASLLGLVTLGIYPLYWMYTVISRLSDNEYRYKGCVKISHSATSFLIWYLLGAFIVVGPLVALCLFLDDVNQYSNVPAGFQPAPYTNNQFERMQMMVVPVSGYSGVIQPLAQNPGAAPNVNRVPDPIPPTMPGEGYSPRIGKIVGVNGMYAGVEFPTRSDEEMVIGTDPAACSIVITENNKFVSRRHCSVKYNAADNKYYVTDYSTNGTFVVDDHKLEKNVESPVNCGAVLSLGSYENGFRLG